MDRAKGRDLMRRHTIAGALYTEGLVQRRTVTTLAGTTVTFRKDIDGMAASLVLLWFIIFRRYNKWVVVSGVMEAYCVFKTPKYFIISCFNRIH